MNTLSTTTQATANYLAAADKIMEFFDSQGFTTDNPPDAEANRQEIARLIREQVEGNVNYASVAG